MYLTGDGLFHFPNAETPGLPSGNVDPPYDGSFHSSFSFALSSQGPNRGELCAVELSHLALCLLQLLSISKKYGCFRTSQARE